MSFPCLKFSSGSLVTGNKIHIIESWLKRLHFPQPKLQPHQPSFFNRPILFQVKAFVLVTLMRPSMSSCLHVHSFFSAFQASIYMSLIREVFLEPFIWALSDYLNQPDCPIYYSSIQHSVYFLYTLVIICYHLFISLDLPSWTRTPWGKGSHVSSSFPACASAWHCCPCNE